MSPASQRFYDDPRFMRGLRTVTRPVAWSAALLSGFLLVYLGGVPLFFRLGLPPRFSLPPFLDLGVLAILSFLAGIVFARFLLRSLPVRADGRRRIVVLVILGTVLAFGVVQMLKLFAGMIVIPDLPDQPSRALDAKPLATATLAWMLGAGAPFLARQLLPRAFLRRPYLLFLRRFYSFSDRVVVSAVLRSAPSGMPVAFLTAPLSTARDWNPFTVAMAGFKLWRPVRSLPVILHSDEPWQDNARTLIEHAKLIVVDGTEGGEAIATEMAMIHDGGFGEKTVVLAPRGASPDAELIDAIGTAGSSVMRYHKSWLRAVPGMLLGALGCVIAVLPITGVALAASPAVDAQGLEAIKWTTPAILWSGVGSAALFGALFLQPALDRGTEKELKKRLRQTASAPPANGPASESSL